MYLHESFLEIVVVFKAARRNRLTRHVFFKNVISLKHYEIDLWLSKQNVPTKYCWNQCVCSMLCSAFSPAYSFRFPPRYCSSCFSYIATLSFSSPKAQTTIKVYDMNSERLQRNQETTGEENSLLKESNTQVRQNLCFLSSSFDANRLDKVRQTEIFPGIPFLSC